MPTLTIDFPVDLQKVLHELEYHYLTSALDAAKYNKSKAARMLSLNRTTLWTKMVKHGIPMDDQNYYKGRQHVEKRI